MSFLFDLRLARVRGRIPPKTAAPEGGRGWLQVTESRDDELRRTVRRASFRLEDKAAPAIPDLLDVTLLAITGSTMSLSGFEEVADGPLLDARRYAQTWLLVPASERELDAALSDRSRLVAHLAHLGVYVRGLPGGGIEIPGEDRWREQLG